MSYWKSKKVFITGGAGFIGSHLVDWLISEGSWVVAYDNFSTGQESFLQGVLQSSSFRLIRGDMLDREALNNAMSGCDFVFHMAANADIRFGVQDPRRDLEQNIIVTSNVLEAMRTNHIFKIVFSSTGSVYGEATTIPTPENAPFPVQTSFYAASKLACEALIEAYCESFGYQGWIFRHVSILGDRYHHGHVLDFYKQLCDHPDRLSVLGDGSQRKSYLDVEDCINGILLGIQKTNQKVNIFNLGTNAYCSVRESIQWILIELGLNPEVSYSGEKRGWIGDNPFIFLDCSKMRSLGWKPKRSIREGVIRTLRYLRENTWLLQER